MSTHNVFDKPNVKKQRDFISDILENEPPYRINEFDVNWYLKFKDITDLAINCFCENCQERRVFTGVVSGEMHNAFSNDALQQAVFKGMTPADPQAFYKDRQYFLNLRLTCALCGEIHYYSLVFKGNTIIKIGQFPSFARKSEQEFIKYKNVISKYYIDLIRSANAYSQHMGIAAFVYLRRIFEHIVETEYAKIERRTGMNLSHFDDKLKVVDKEIKIIPPELDAQKSKIYSVLSKGVHEYDEEECYELYPIIKVIIMIVLDMYLQEKERTKQLTGIAKFLTSK